MLEEMVSRKREELELVKQVTPAQELLRQLPKNSPASFQAALNREDINIIAEIKYRSPSHGPFACQMDPVEVAKIYSEAGAVAISVLTEQHYFAGKLQFLEDIHGELPQMPLLRKDFILDYYQVLEARLKGASAYLLIVSSLSVEELSSLISSGQEHELDALVEVHNLFELDRAVSAGARVIGVNNRNLKTFEVNIGTSFDIARRLEGEDHYILVSESGIQEHTQIAELKDAGFRAFLVGSVLMDASDPGEKLQGLKGQR